ncbi:MAG: hypothetical protein HBSIN02_15220 [Bacteroidia bacterium]|nr:MAG: hypothetical protein HBSIN02_15220 [Bacteroidia bacterium]
MKRIAVLCGAALLAGGVATLSAQTPQAPELQDLRVPRISQGARVEQMIGLSKVSIFYHRPGVKGRTIFGPKGSGALLPYGEVWRAGANEPTLFTFSDDVTIGGKRLRAGTYRFLAVPGASDWTLIFNSEVRNWGTVYQPEYDTLKVTVKPLAGPHEEWMSFSFADLTPTSATVILAWDKVRIPFTVEFNLLSKLQASVGNSGILHGAARYALDHGLYLKEAHEWVDRSLALDKNFFNLRTKAEILAKEGKYAEALATGDEALKLIRARDINSLPDFQQDMVRAFEKLHQQWKAMK